MSVLSTGGGGGGKALSEQIRRGLQRWPPDVRSCGGGVAYPEKWNWGGVG